MTKKLNKEHIEAILDLQTKFSQNASTLGNIVIEQHMLENRLELIKTEHNNYLGSHKVLVETEQALLAELKEEYGDGQINIQDGTFTPNEVAVATVLDNTVEA